MNPWKQYQDQNKERFLEELLALLRIPSISAKSENNGDMRTCAKAVEEALKQAGAPVTKIYETAGHPIVYGDIMMFNLLIHWNYGIAVRLTLRSKMVKYMHVAHAMIKGNSTCM